MSDTKTFCNAVENGVDRIVLSTLEEHTIDVNVVWRGWSPVHLAALHGHVSTLNILIKHGASLTKLNYAGDNALHVALSMGTTKRYEHIVRTLLLHSLNDDDDDDCWMGIHTVNRHGMTPISQAAFKSSTSVVQLLLDNGANPNDQDPTGHNALHHLAMRDTGSNAVKQKICKMIIWSRPDIDCNLRLVEAETDEIEADSDSEDEDGELDIPPMTPCDVVKPWVLKHKLHRNTSTHAR